MEINVIQCVVAYLLEQLDEVEFNGPEYNQLQMMIHKCALHDSDIPIHVIHMNGVCGQTTWLRDNNVVAQVAEASMRHYFMMLVFTDNVHRIGRFINFLKNLLRK